MRKFLTLLFLLLSSPAQAQGVLGVGSRYYHPNCLVITSEGTTLASCSLFFRQDTAQYITKTGSNALNQQIFTMSVWVRTDLTGNTKVIYEAGDSTLDGFRFAVLGDDTFQIIARSAAGATVDINLITTATFGPSAFRRVTIAVDTTQATAANRVRLFVRPPNGSDDEVVAFNTAIYPALNANLSNNFATTYTIGASTAFDSVLAGALYNFYYIDSQYLTTPSVFGISFSFFGVTITDKYTGTYSTAFDYYLDFMTRTTITTVCNDKSGNGNDWTPVNMTAENSSVDFPVP